MSLIRFASALCALSLYSPLAAADSAPETRRASVDFATCAKPEWPKEALDRWRSSKGEKSIRSTWTLPGAPKNAPQP